MAEAIGVASGLVGLGTFAFQASVALYETINSYKSHQQRVRDLAEEAAALGTVLGSLVDTVNSSNFDLSALEIPLRQCGRACEDFNKQIQKCSSRSTGERASVRDWARMRYMGEDIDGFRRQLSSYKMTITVALTDANLRQSSNAVAGIEGYKELLNSTREDLEDRLVSIDDKLDEILNKGAPRCSPDSLELKQIREEKLSTQKSLEICGQLSMHINQLELSAGAARAADENSNESSAPENITREGLDGCRKSLSAMAAKLKRHEKLLFDRLTEKLTTSMSSPDEGAEIARLRDEWESTHESLGILSSADNYMEQQRSVIENHATGDAVQIMVSTDGKTLHGTNKGLGWRTRQIGGHMNDETLRQISRDLVTVTVKSPDKKAEGISTAASRDTGNNQPSEFMEKYGGGFKLTSKAK